MRTLLVLLLLGVSLAACGGVGTLPSPSPAPHETPSAGGSATAGPTGEVIVPDGSADNAVTPTEDQPGASGPGRIDCGEIVMPGTPPHAPSDGASVQAASACFLKAWDSCSAAILTIRERVTNLVRQFSIEPGSKCDLREVLQPDPNSPPAVVDCTGAESVQGGLVVKSCSHLGDFTLIPDK
jgi:predicted small lipoprotein YifL